MRNSVGAAFVFSVALLAAVLGDAIVEGISNAGILWHGNYTDRSSVDLLPVLCISIVASMLTLALSLLYHARKTGLSLRSLTLWTANLLIPRRLAHILPAIFILQMAALFVMETAEQIVVYGRAAGGTLWLGGPLAASLIIHAVFAVLCAFVLSKFLRLLADGVKRIAIVLGTFMAAERGRPLIVGRVGRTPQTAVSLVLGSRFERGPPLPAIS
jgi:hypothetical protein